MKRLLWFLSVGLLLTGCSDENTTKADENPYRPISGLTIPREAAAGSEVVISGEGFHEDCSIALQLNGSVETIAAEVVNVDEKSLTFIVPEQIYGGFYAVILTQNGTSYRIGGINLKSGSYDVSDFEIYVLAGADLEIYTASVSNQIINPTPLPDSRTKHLDNSGYVEALPNGDLYYTSHGVYVEEGWIVNHRGLGYYNLVTGERTEPQYMDDLYAIGQIDGEFCILRHFTPKAGSGDPKSSIYTLEWYDSKESIDIDFAPSGIGTTTILSNDMRFIHYAKENVILLCGRLDTGEVQERTSLAIDLDNKTVHKVGKNDRYRYAYVVVKDELYCFATEYAPADGDDSSGSVLGTKVLRITDVRSWSLSSPLSGAELCCTISGAGFASPVYSPETGMIYGSDGEEGIDQILTYNPHVNRVESKRWIKPGIGGMFYFRALE